MSRVAENIKIENAEIGNVKTGNTEIGKMELPFSATILQAVSKFLLISIESICKYKDGKGCSTRNRAKAQLRCYLCP